MQAAKETEPQRTTYESQRKMKLYERDNELKQLQEIQEAAEHQAQMVIITGCRRIGKTQLVLQATKGRPAIYFHIARKAEPILCRELAEQASKVLDSLQLPDETADFRSLFKAIMAASKDKSFTLIIDGIQEFATINQGIYADLQSIWARNKERSRLCLLLLGTDSAQTTRLFEGNHAPLHGLVTHHIQLHPYTTTTLKKLLRKASPTYTYEDLLALYTLTGGIPKYIHSLLNAGATTPKAMIQHICQEDSPFLTEGKQLLIEDFGKEYTIYFSILTCIANGIFSRSFIEEYIQKEIGGYLTRLETDFHLIQKQTPLFTKSGSKNVRYAIADNFLRFWFRFIYRNIHLTETQQYRTLRNAILAEFRSYYSQTLYIYHRQLLMEDARYDTIGGWWDQHGDNDIDILALDTKNHQALIADVRRRITSADRQALIRKASTLHEFLEGYQIDYQLLGTDNL